MRCYYLKLGLSLCIVARYIFYLYSLSSPSQAKTRESSARAMVAMLCMFIEHFIRNQHSAEVFIARKKILSHLAVTNVSNYCNRPGGTVVPPYVGLNGKTRWRLHTMYLHSNTNISRGDEFYTSKDT